MIHIGTTVVQSLAVGSEAIFFQELLGASNTLISIVATYTYCLPMITCTGIGGHEFGITCTCTAVISILYCIKLTINAYGYSAHEYIAMLISFIVRLLILHTYACTY